MISTTTPQSPPPTATVKTASYPKWLPFFSVKFLQRLEYHLAGSGGGCDGFAAAGDTLTAPLTVVGVDAVATFAAGAATRVSDSYLGANVVSL